MTGLFDYIRKNYEKLVPKKSDGLLLFKLHQKINNKEIAKEFTYQDIEKSINEIAKKELGDTIPHTERILGNLLPYYIERPPDNAHNKYVLTDYAQHFLELVENKLDNPLSKLPLRKSFEKYGQFDADDISTIVEFEGWYQNGFNNTTKRNIIDHLESLKDELNIAIESLKEILYSPERDVVEIVADFTNIFKKLGTRANEIGDALQLKNHLKHEIEKVINFFYTKIEETKAPISQQEIVQYNILEKEYNQAKTIAEKVEDFFTTVEYKLKQLTERILFADQRLNDLKDNFQYRSQFNINTTKLLQLVLKEANYSKEGPDLPAAFPRKKYIQENIRYIKIPYRKFDIAFNNEIIPIHVDNEQQIKQRKEVDAALKKTERIAELTTHYKKLLTTEKKLDFTQQFYQLLQEENDIEIAIQVGFEIIQYANNSKKYNIDTNQLLHEIATEKNIWTWKTKIHQKA